MARGRLVIGTSPQVDHNSKRRCIGLSRSHHGVEGHAHGSVDPTVLRSRVGIKAVLSSLGVLAVTAVVQMLIYLWTDSAALLSDLFHNVGDALTAIPVGLALAMRNERAERWSGKAVVAAIFISGCFALYSSVQRLVDPRPLEGLAVLALAGLAGFTGNQIAAAVRTRAGDRIGSAALIADGKHARADAMVSLGVVLSAGAVAGGLPIADPIIGFAIALFILRITWQAWRTVRT